MFAVEKYRDEIMVYFKAGIPIYRIGEAFAISEEQVRQILDMNEEEKYLEVINA